MNRSSQLMIVLAVVSGAVIGHFMSIKSPKPEVIYPGRSDFANPCTQKSKGRIWKEVKLDTVVSISNYKGKPILEPLRVKVGQDGYIYVVDVYAPGVLKFSQNGNFVQLYGKGKGEAPGEFELPHDFSVNSSGEYLYSFKFKKLPGTEGIRSTVVCKGYLYTCEYLQNGSTLVRKYKLRF
ncbi:MAG: 6-bladed beta-propeller [Bacteroidota bacterium]